jgi:hypothetical protein
MFQFGLGLEKGYTGFAKKSEAMLPWCFGFGLENVFSGSKEVAEAIL